MRLFTRIYLMTALLACVGTTGAIYCFSKIPIDYSDVHIALPSLTNHVLSSTPIEQGFKDIEIKAQSGHVKIYWSEKNLMTPVLKSTVFFEQPDFQMKLVNQTLIIEEHFNIDNFPSSFLHPDLILLLPREWIGQIKITSFEGSVTVGHRQSPAIAFELQSESGIISTGESTMNTHDAKTSISIKTKSGDISVNNISTENFNEEN